MVDASDVALGGTLQQWVENAWQPLALCTQKLSGTEMTYSAYDRELLAAYSTVKRFRQFVDGRNFTIFTDHKLLIYSLKHKPEKASRQFRYLDFISQFTTDFEYVSDTSNTPADALSRLDAVTSRSIQCIDYEQLQAAQEQDEKLAKVFQTHTGLELKKLFVSGYV